MRRVSVVMSVYNGSRYLREAMDSILSQTFRDFEFIILNDGSTDGSAEIIRSYCDTRIRYVEKNENMGLTRSLNQGLSMARGVYIARMDADDISLPKRFEHQIAFLDAHPEVGVLGTAAQLINGSGIKGEIIRFSPEHGFLRWLMCFVVNPIIHPSVMVRRHWIEQVGGYDEHMVTSQDYELWCRLSGLTRLANITDVLLLLRKHEENISSVRFKEGIEKVFEVNRRLIDDVLGGRVPDSEIRSLWRFIFSPQDTVAQEAQATEGLIRQLYRSYLSSGWLTAAEEHLVRTDASERWNTLIRGQEGKKESKRFYSFACGKDEVIEPSCKLICYEHNQHLALDRTQKDGKVQYLACFSGCRFPIIRGIPRFVDSESYASAFGAQWKAFSKTQLDSFSESSISRDRLSRLMGGTLDVNGKNVLEAGCGAGRFTEILLMAGARVFACDLSDAVEANWENCSHYPNYFICQADISKLPLAPEKFDIVICLGVIQHTPNPEDTITALCAQVAPGGMLAIDHYTYGYDIRASRRFLRSFLLGKSTGFTLTFCKCLVKLLWPIHRFLWKFREKPAASRLRGWFLALSPVVDYHDAYPQLGTVLLHDWAVLDTHDTLTDVYKHLRSKEEIEEHLKVCGMVDIEAYYAGNGVEARAKKPIGKKSAGQRIKGASE